MKFSWLDSELLFLILEDIFWNKMQSNFLKNYRKANKSRQKSTLPHTETSWTKMFFMNTTMFKLLTLL